MIANPLPATASHWHPVAQSWKQLGPPLRPCAEDVSAYQRLARDWSAHHGPPRVLLLGVTPEIHRLPWPDGHDFLAVDRTPAMIDHVWPGPRRQVLQADWLDLPLPAASRDLALCDGGLPLLRYPLDQKKLIDALHRVLAPGGRCIFRLFTPPPKPESPETVLADLLSAQIPNLNILKLRLGMAMQASPERGIAVREVWTKLRSLAADWETLSTRLGWPLEHLKVVDAYRESDATYHFITAAQAENLFCESGKFACRASHTGTYLLSERCPIVEFERL